MSVDGCAPGRSRFSTGALDAFAPPRLIMLQLPCAVNFSKARIMP
jgi:hypothetical protein